MADVIVEHNVLSQDDTVAPGQQRVNRATILKAFELRRRAHALAAVGSEGVFAGYDVLEFDFDGDIAAGDVRVTSRLLEAVPGRHALEYRATLVRNTRVVTESVDEVLLARGVGWTLTPRRA